MLRSFAAEFEKIATKGLLEATEGPVLPLRNPQEAYAPHGAANLPSVKGMATKAKPFTRWLR